MERELLVKKKNSTGAQVSELGVNRANAIRQNHPTTQLN